MLFDFTLDGTSFFVMIFSLTVESILQKCVGLVKGVSAGSGRVRLGGCSFAVVVGGSGEAERKKRGLGGRCVTTVAIMTNCITTTWPWIESCEHDL